MKTPTWKLCRYLRWSCWFCSDAIGSHRASLQLRPPGRHHGSGLPEPWALCDGGREGRLGEGVEDRRGVSAGFPRPPVSPAGFSFITVDRLAQMGRSIFQPFWKSQFKGIILKVFPVFKFASWGSQQTDNLRKRLVTSLTWSCHVETVTL